MTILTFVLTYDTLSLILEIDEVTTCHFRGGLAMPKATFFNLPQDKKDNLLAAVEKEFSRVPLYEASISNIVKTANIPRGSFYQYFEDKDDVYFYLLNKQIRKKRNQFLSCLAEYDGNLFDATTHIFELSIDDHPEREELHFLKNTFLNMTHEIEKNFSRIFNVNSSEDQFKDISSLINKDILNVNNNEELHHLMQMISMVIFHNLIEKYAHNLTFEQAMNNFSTQMDLLKHGISKCTTVQK